MSNGYATPSAALAAYIAANPDQQLDERQELEGYIWDTFKSINGIRPRWYRMSEWTIEQLREEADSLGAQIQAELKREKEAKQQAVREANARAHARRTFDKNFNSLANGFS